MNFCDDLDALRAALGQDIPDDDVVAAAVKYITQTKVRGEKAAPREFCIQVNRAAGRSNRYFITANTELDARVIAFCLDGGHNGNLVDQDIIKLAKEWTKVL